MKVKLLANYLPELGSIVGGRRKPLAVSLNITSSCNQHCIYCEIGQGIASHKKKNLDFNDLKILIDAMSTIGIKRLSINGGEPFMYDKIIELIVYAGDKDIRCNITSNGMVIWRLHKRDFVILKKHQTEINISVDSLNKEIHNFTRGRSNALENVEKSTKALLNSGILPTYLSAISKYNCADLYDSMVKAHKLGIKTVLYQPIIYTSNYPDRPAIEDKSNFNISDEQIPALMIELKKILKYEFFHGIKTNVYRLLPWIESYLNFVNGLQQKYFWQNILPVFKCRDLFAIVDIAYDGEIQPCAFSSSGIFINQLSDKGLVDLWQEAGSKLKQETAAGDFPQICNSCCNHFSRNMIYSAIRFPVRNYKALFKVLYHTFRRLISTFLKLFILRK